MPATARALSPCGVSDSQTAAPNGSSSHRRHRSPAAARELEHQPAELAVRDRRVVPSLLDLGLGASSDCARTRRRATPPMPSTRRSSPTRAGPPNATCPGRRTARDPATSLRGYRRGVTAARLRVGRCVRRRRRRASSRRCRQRRRRPRCRCTCNSPSIWRRWPELAIQASNSGSAVVNPAATFSPHAVQRNPLGGEPVAGVGTVAAGVAHGVGGGHVGGMGGRRRRHLVVPHQRRQPGPGPLDVDQLDDLGRLVELGHHDRGRRRGDPARRLAHRGTVIDGDRLGDQRPTGGGRSRRHQQGDDDPVPAHGAGTVADPT